MDSDAVREPLDPRLTGAMGAAEKPPAVLHPVADHATTAMLAARSQLMNGALERIERKIAFPEMNFEGFVIGVPAGVADWHIITGLRAPQLSNPGSFFATRNMHSAFVRPLFILYKHRSRRLYTNSAYLHNPIYGPHSNRYSGLGESRLCAKISSSVGKGR